MNQYKIESTALVDAMKHIKPEETVDEHVIEQLTKRMDFASGLAVGIFVGIVIMALVGRI